MLAVKDFGYELRGRANIGVALFNDLASSWELSNL